VKTRNQTVWGKAQRRLLLFIRQILLRQWLFIPFFAGLIKFIAGYPGWILGDGISEWQQAVQGPIWDWHPPILIWLWAHLGAKNLGPLIPYLLSMSILWSCNIYISRIIFLRQNTRYLFLIPTLILLCIPSIQQLGWLTQDTISTTSFLVGICFLLFTSRKRVHITIAGIAIGFASILRIFDFPVFMLVAFSCLTVVSNKNHTKLRIRKFVSLVVIATLSLLAFHSFETIVIKPNAQYSAQASMYLDFMRVECSIRKPQKVLPSVGVFPREYLQPNALDFCQNFNPTDNSAYIFSQNSLQNWGDKNHARQMYENLKKDWFTLWKKYSTILVSYRIQTAAQDVTSNYSEYWLPSLNSTSGSGLLQRGNIGEGSHIGFPSRAGLALVITVFPIFLVTHIGSPSGYLFGSWLTTVPIFILWAAILIRKKTSFKSVSKFRFKLVLTAVILHVLIYATLAVADPRYMLISTVMAMLLPLIIWVTELENKPHG
jgi:hypothetical protein